MLTIGPTEDGRPSTAYAAATRYAKELRDAGTDIYVVNPGYRIIEDEGRTIATSVDNVKKSPFDGLNAVQDQVAQGISQGKKMLTKSALVSTKCKYLQISSCVSFIEIL